MSFEDVSFLKLAVYPLATSENKSPIDLRSDTVTKPTAAMRQVWELFLWAPGRAIKCHSFLCEPPLAMEYLNIALNFHTYLS